MARRHTDLDLDTDHVAQQLMEWRGQYELPAAQYGWPHEVPLSIWRGSITAIATETSPDDPLATIDRIKKVITHVALGDTVDATEVAKCGAPKHVDLLRKTVIPGVLQWINRHPEHRPQRIELLTPQGDIS
ncbi:MAG: hypothetical protein WAS36_03730 [Candidatus Saccharimonadales bacterium]